MIEKKVMFCDVISLVQIATYPDDGILYRSSNMVLCSYSYARFHNESKGRSRSGAHMSFLKMTLFHDGMGLY